MSVIKVRNAIACEDLRQEVDGKLFAIGIINPIIWRGKPREDGTWPPIKLHFILSLDVPEAGEYEMRFRLRPSPGNDRRSQTKVRVRFLAAAENVPFPIGPLRARPGKETTSFLLEQALDENRWKRVAKWRLEDATEASE